MHRLTEVICHGSLVDKNVTSGHSVVKQETLRLKQFLSFTIHNKCATKNHRPTNRRSDIIAMQGRTNDLISNLM